MRIPTEALARLPDYQSRNAGRSESARISLEEYATLVATPDLLFAFAALFFCEMVEVEKHYFIKERFERGVYEDWKTRRDDLRDIQRVMNRLQVSTLLQGAQMDDALARSCAELLAAVWTEVHIRRGVTAEVHGTTANDLSVTLVNLHE
jgi:hypothetical protein